MRGQKNGLIALHSNTHAIKRHQLSNLLGVGQVAIKEAIYVTQSHGLKAVGKYLVRSGQIDQNWLDDILENYSDGCEKKTV